MEGNGFQQFAVGGNFLASLQQNGIAHHHVFARYLHRAAVPYGLYRLVVVHLVEQGKFFVGFQFKNKSQSGGQQYGDEDARRFKENTGALVKAKKLVTRNTHRECASYEKDKNQGIAELFQEPFPPRNFGRRGKYIYAVFCAALFYLLCV